MLARSCDLRHLAITANENEPLSDGFGFVLAARSLRNYRGKLLDRAPGRGRMGGREYFWIESNFSNHFRAAFHYFRTADAGVGNFCFGQPVYIFNGYLNGEALKRFAVFWLLSVIFV